jgi:cysteinyl-tRNA synthetase
MIRLYNTFTRKKEEFETLEPNLVKLYVCGVTVYNDAHVGHAMSALVFDIMRRYLEYRGYTVRHVMNYTDVDDKIIRRAKELGEEPLELSQRYIEDYANDLDNLNVLPATSNPQVSKTMPLIIEFIQGLIQKEAAYAAPNGDVYFSVTSDDDYGKLSNRKLDDMQAGARIEVGEAKDHPMDFALWKAAKPGEISWDSPWGKGRPGWHIECSAMNLAELGEEPLELSQRYIEDYANDLDNLNVLPATSNPQVSKTMPLIIEFIQGLIQKEAAYAASNGDVYFSVTIDDDYGKLSNRKLDDMQAGARIAVGEANDHPMDFALWKAAKPGEISWDSPWGKGRPGWHIECSAMNLAELGEQIDIHGGGNDLIFPHHENEIAQTESYTGKQFARYWVHNGMLQLGGEKMSKSLGNMVTIKDFLKTRDADVMRMLVLSGNYRAPLIFNEETQDAAEKNIERLKTAIRPASASASGFSAEAASVLVPQADSTKQSFTNAMDDDFNAPLALAALYELVKAINTARDNGANDEQLKSAQGTLRELTDVLGLRLQEKQGSSDADAQVNDLIAERTEARQQKQWARSDELRDQLKEMGVTIEDSKDGTKWRWG